MNKPLQITVLADNTVARGNVLGEHGLALWIRAGDTRLLFDTGQGTVLTQNARALGIDLGSADALVLSHGHYDHTGGLAQVLGLRENLTVVHGHPHAFLPKYIREGAGTRFIGMPEACRQALLGDRCRWIPSRQPAEVAPGIRTTGEIFRRHPEESTSESFCGDPEGSCRDHLPDDLALLLQTGPGTVVLLGCAHAGLINTLDHVLNLTGGEPIRAVIGGAHMRSASDAQLAWTIAGLRRFEVSLLAPMHCTGQKAIAALWAAFPGACRPCGAGTTFEF